MRAVDTDVVVRYLTNDDAGQAARARRLLEREQVFLPLTVLLETEWVLRSVYGFAASEVIAALCGFVGLPHVVVEHPDAAACALGWAQQGLDFADALHLAVVRSEAGSPVTPAAPARGTHAGDSRRDRGGWPNAASAQYRNGTPAATSPSFDAIGSVANQAPHGTEAARR